jgi:hypothetical protein
MKTLSMFLLSVLMSTAVLAQATHQSELTRSSTPLSTVLGDTSGWNVINTFTFLKHAADTSNSTRTTPQTIGGLETNLLAGSIYEFEANVQFTSAATTTGIILGFSYPSSPTSFSAEFYVPVAVNGTAALFEGQQTALTDSVITTTVGATTATYTVKIVGKINNVNAGAIRLWYKSSVPASAITIKAGSTMRIRKV